MRGFSVGDATPGFTLPDQDGKSVRLADVYQQKHVLLVFNIGFA